LVQLPYIGKDPHRQPRGEGSNIEYSIETATYEPSSRNSEKYREEGASSGGGSKSHEKDRSPKGWPLALVTSMTDGKCEYTAAKRKGRNLHYKKIIFSNTPLSRGFVESPEKRGRAGTSASC